MQIIGIQKDGSSPAFIKRMALEAYEKICNQRPIVRSADIGCGRGELSKLLSLYGYEIVMADCYQPTELSPKASFVKIDPNSRWLIDSDPIGVAFAVEAIEHVEDPRRFGREPARIFKLKGFAYLSAPNNHSLMSKITSLTKGKHRLFQSLYYPGHITALLKCDCSKILSENNLQFLIEFYSDEYTLPLLHRKFKTLKDVLRSLGLVVRKAACKILHSICATQLDKIALA